VIPRNTGAKVISVEAIGKPVSPFNVAARGILIIKDPT
jgi:hypothetical protein